MELVLIAAVAANGVIGREDTLPWHLPEDLAHFKETTMGHPVIMGRIAYEDIEDKLGGPLPGRTNVVLSRSDPDVAEDVIVVADVDAAVRAAAEQDGELAFVAGGASVYEAFLPLVDRMILTELEDPYEGDVYFPEFDTEEWREIDRRGQDEFTIVEYERSA